MAGEVRVTQAGSLAESEPNATVVVTQAGALAEFSPFAEARVTQFGILAEFEIPEGDPPPPELECPTDLVAVASLGQVDLTWTDTSTGETGFEVWRFNPTTSVWTLIAVLGPNATSYSDTSVGEGAGYCYRVRAYLAQE